MLSIVASIVYPALAGWANVRRAYGARDSFGMAGARGARSGEANSPLQKARNSRAMKKKDGGLPDANRRDSHKTGESPALRTPRAGEWLFCGSLFYGRWQVRADEGFDAGLNVRVALNFDVRLFEQAREPRIPVAADGMGVVVELEISDDLRA